MYLCDEIRMVLPCSRLVLMQFQIHCLDAGSTPVVGSSSNKIWQLDCCASSMDTHLGHCYLVYIIDYNATNAKAAFSFRLVPPDKLQTST